MNYSIKLPNILRRALMSGLVIIAGTFTSLATNPAPANAPVPAPVKAPAPAKAVVPPAPKPPMTPKAELQSIGKPDLEAIHAAVNDESNRRYYPKLLNRFMANDTTMTPMDYQYFYYGAMFQEDYNPYREAPYPELLEEVTPLYNKEKTSRAERHKMLDYAMKALEDNPLNLKQLTNRVYVYEKNGKYDLARIWQHKLNHILLVIAASGSGTTPEDAMMVVYPGNEYEYLNLSGHTAIGQRFQEPCYDFIEVNRKSHNDPEGYYFNILEMLKQYFAKHPSEN